MSRNFRFTRNCYYTRVNENPFITIGLQVLSLNFLEEFQIKVFA